MSMDEDKESSFKDKDKDLSSIDKDLMSKDLKIGPRGQELSSRTTTLIALWCYVLVYY